MKKTELKSFDIASFDIELEYNSKIAPINTKILKLNKNHETKSLKAHKDFLAKEKQSKEKLALLSDKAVLRDQRIEKAVENKLVKLRSKDNRFKKEFDEYKVIQTSEFNIKLEEIDIEIKELETSQADDITGIKEKYDKNVTSYVEKLDTYNNNYNNNKRLHKQQIIEYDELLVSKLKEISEIKETLDKNIQNKLDIYIERKTNENNNTDQSLLDVERELNNQTTHIRMESNIKVKEIKAFIEGITSEYENNSKAFINELEEQIDLLETEFSERELLVQKDLEMNLNKLNDELNQDEENQTKKTKKSIKMKIELFNLRASTTVGYEERILNEKILILKKEVEFAKETLAYELKNYEKLEVFLLSDQNELKDIGDYFKSINLTLKSELNNFELSNNDYLVKHEKLKTEFVNRYTSLFDGFKNKLLSSNKSSIDQLTGINQEIDEINKYLDTADPLKEIKVNRLRESIEANEVKERYNIRFAKQQHEIKLLNNQLENLIEIEKCNVKDKISENNKEITNIKNKETLDKALGKAKLKNEKATEVYKLRLNSTKLENNLLDGKFEKELQIFEFEKNISEIEVQKNNILITKEIEMEIKNINLEANYKIEVINKRLEEDLLKLDEEVNKLRYEQDSYSSALDLEISTENLKGEKERNTIHLQTDKKLSLINEALDREIRNPSLNMAKSQVVIDERINKFVISNVIYEDFIEESTNLLIDENLEIKQIKQIASNSENLIDKSTKYIQRTYETLNEALNFMSELELRTIKQKISTTKESGSIKKLNKILQKTNIEINKQKTAVNNARLDHETVIKNQIKLELSKFAKSKTEDIETLKGSVRAIYTSTYTSLKNLQDKILVQVNELYAPITKNDKELIENAEENSRKAIALVEQDRINKIDPINEAFDVFTNEVDERRKIKLAELDILISELKGTIKTLKDNSLDEVRVIKDDINELITVKSDHLVMIDKTESSEIVKQIEAIDGRKNDLDNIYKETTIRLGEKNSEAKKIFDYEERIYNIAIETANSRYNDSLNKTENGHLLNIKENNKDIDSVNKDAENFLKQINKDLLELTSKFEKNIFTTRPRLEESIGDAQKAIDKESKVKEKRLIELQDTHQKIALSLESSLYTFFQEGYEKLLQNLSFYLEKYKIIADEYNSSITTSNNVISDNNIVFANALFEQGKKKHTTTLNKLLEINTDKE